MADELFTAAFVTTLVTAAIRTATPLLLTAEGELFGERSGVLNMSLEGIMGAGAFTAYAASVYTGSNLIGFFCAVLVGAFLGLLVAFTTITLRVNQIVIGLALVLLLTGLVGFLFRGTFGASLVPKTTEPLQKVAIPVLADIPVLGPVLFQQNILVYLAFSLVPILSLLLFRTTYGLKVRAVGEKPDAADTLGINVYLTRYVCVVFSGVMAGMGGAYLSLEVGFFREYMVAGRGWIAIAICIFGSWSPTRAMAGALLFGLLDAFQIRIAQFFYSIPYMLLQTLPYIVTVIALAVSRTTGGPSALGEPYVRGGEET